MKWQDRLAPVLLLALSLTLPGPWARPAVAEARPPADAAALVKLPPTLKQADKVRGDLEALLTTYGRAIRGVEVLGGDQVHLVMRDGQKILYDDGQAKNFEDKLARPDLEDMLSQPYKLGKPVTGGAVADDPGRIRVEAFFNAVYGASAAQVQGNLVPVSFAGARVNFNAENGAAAALARVGAKLSEVLAQEPGLRAAVLPLAGTYNRRQIAGTNRTSAHSWGIAIDLHQGRYWRWGKSLGPAELLALRTAYPQEIVAAFEAEGFIWGGKWFHYDTMHFEYRPELVAKARRSAGPAQH